MEIELQHLAEPQRRVVDTNGLDRKAVDEARRVRLRTLGAPTGNTLSGKEAYQRLAQLRTPKMLIAELEADRPENIDANWLVWHLSRAPAALEPLDENKRES